MMPVEDYSTDPNSNTEINGINVAEGCAPGNINNAIRQVMADIAEGVVHAYPQTLDPTKQAAARVNIGADKTVNYTAQTLTAPQQAQARDNIGAADSATAVAVTTQTFTPEQQAIAQANIGLSMAGMVAMFAGTTPPIGWLKANGATVSRSTYAALFAAIGTTYGAGDGSTTFALPDLRGEFVRGWDDGRGVDSGRVIGSAQGDAVQDHSHLSGIATQPGVNATEYSRWGRVDSPLPNGNLIPINSGSSVDRRYAITSGVVTDGAAILPAGSPPASGPFAKTDGRSSSETRPRNVALLPCIKY